MICTLTHHIIYSPSRTMTWMETFSKQMLVSMHMVQILGFLYMDKMPTVPGSNTATPCQLVLVAARASCCLVVVYVYYVAVVYIWEDDDHQEVTCGTNVQFV